MEPVNAPVCANDVAPSERWPLVDVLDSHDGALHRDHRAESVLSLNPIEDGRVTRESIATITGRQLAELYAAGSLDLGNDRSLRMCS